MSVSKVKCKTTLPHELNTIYSTLEAVMGHLHPQSSKESRSVEYLVLGNQALRRLKNVCDLLERDVLSGKKYPDFYLQPSKIERPASHANSN